MKKSYEFQNFFDNFDAFITYHNGNTQIYMHTHTKVTIIIFSRILKLSPATQAFFLSFHRLIKPTTFTPAVITKPLLAQNILGLTLAIKISVISDVFNIW